MSAQAPLPLVAKGTKDSISVTGYFGEGGTDAAFRADWTGMDGRGARFAIRVLKPGAAGTKVDELVIAGVEQYLDQRVHFTRNGVVTDLPLPLLEIGIDRMIGTAAAHFGAPALVLSPATRDQLARVSRIDWSKASFGVNGGDDQEKYLAIFYYVRAQRQELERQLRNDLLPLAALAVVPPVQGTADLADAARAEPAPTVCNTVFDDQNFLCALDLRADSAGLPDVQLTDAMLADIASRAGAGAAPSPKLRKRDRWLKAELDAINQKIGQLDQRKELWALRDRLDDLEDRVSDLGLQVEEVKAGRADAGAHNPLADLSTLTGKNITIRFAKGEAELGPGEKMLLDEVVRAMGQASGSRLLVTGYADKSGDPALNLALSERRAKAVRSFLIGHGIGAERVLLNYFGAANSMGPDAAERRVELEWTR